MDVDVTDVVEAKGGGTLLVRGSETEYGTGTVRHRDWFVWH